MRALVIDDSRAMRNIIKSMLKDLGFEVKEAAHGREGLEQLATYGAPDIVLVDWNMPVMNGLEFIQAARQNPVYNDMRIMMVTTETEVAQIMKALQAGADEYVMKPFTKGTISEKIELLGIVPA
ncbi:MAG: response regulator [Rhodothermales bacterium]